MDRNILVGITLKEHLDIGGLVILKHTLNQ
jgi:hypothetical protein